MHGKDNDKDSIELASLNARPRVLPHLPENVQRRIVTNNAVLGRAGPNILASNHPTMLCNGIVLSLYRKRFRNDDIGIHLLSVHHLSTVSPCVFRGIHYPKSEWEWETAYFRPELESMSVRSR